MATRTISDAGGNWASASAWVEGVVPVAADNIVATPTSGNLNITTSVSCAGFNLTGYTGVCTLSSQLIPGPTFSVPAGTFIAATSGTLYINTNNANITTNGTNFYGLTLFGANTFNFNDDVSCEYLRFDGSVTNGLKPVGIGGTRTIRIGSRGVGTVVINQVNIATGTIYFEIVGTCSWTNAGSLVYDAFDARLILNATNSTITNSGTWVFGSVAHTGGGPRSANSAFIYNAGTLAGGKAIVLRGGGSGDNTLLLDLKGITMSAMSTQAGNSGGFTITLASTFSCDAITTEARSTTYTGANILVKRLNGSAFNLPAGYTTTISNYLYIANSLLDGSTVIKSSSAGTRANIAIGATLSLLAGNSFQDLNFSPSYTSLYGSQTNCSGLTIVQSISAGGGTGSGPVTSAYTFLT